MSITSYLKKSGVKFKTKGIKSYGEYIADFIKESFNNKIELSKDEIRLLEHVINGQGHEKEKITSPYSSSLQSFFIFRKISKNNTILINGLEYNKVEFEYQNPVIGFPSSIDVKLSYIDENDEEKYTLFIESKLYEVIRDSREKYGTEEIGPSYFSGEKNGYINSLNLTYENLSEIGIVFPLDEYMYGKNKSVIKKKINTKRNRPDDKGWSQIDALKPNKWVYSYGIKQILSHIIGILNYKGSPLEKRKFAYIYNALPGFDEKDAQEKIENYNSHVETVCEKLIDKNPKLETVLQKPIITYQELYTEENAAYFESVGKEICNYYKLKLLKTKEKEI